MTSDSLDNNNNNIPRPPAAAPANVAAPDHEKQLPCPRCDSTNTKFCYYNNYNASQPRHFCKSCRRYWTHGGTLRDIPIGGGSRKNAKRSRTWSSSSSYSSGFTSSSSQDLFPTGPGLVSLGPGFGGRSFTSLIGGVSGPGFFGLGLGYELGFGVEKSGWPSFADGGGNTWQGESGGNGYVDNESFSWPELAICAPGQHGCLK